jgi:hypothetical protein
MMRSAFLGIAMFLSLVGSSFAQDGTVEFLYPKGKPALAQDAQSTVESALEALDGSLKQSAVPTSQMSLARFDFPGNSCFCFRCGSHWCCVCDEPIM